jgi:hypothetical protein
MQCWVEASCEEEYKKPIFDVCYDNKASSNSGAGYRKIDGQNILFKVWEGYFD